MQPYISINWQDFMTLTRFHNFTILTQVDRISQFRFNFDQTKFWLSFTILTRYQSAFVIRRDVKDKIVEGRGDKGNRRDSDREGEKIPILLYPKNFGIYCDFQSYSSPLKPFLAQLMHHARCQWKWCRIFIQL